MRCGAPLDGLTGRNHFIAADGLDTGMNDFPPRD
jgi:hypothetical protein